MADPWRVLGVPRHSSAEECKRAFQQRALQCHPDLNASPAAARDFQHLREAYEFLRSVGFNAARAEATYGNPGGYSSGRYDRGGGSTERSRARAEAFRAMQAAARRAAQAAEEEAMRGGGGSARAGSSSSARGEAHAPPPLLRTLHRALDVLFQPRVLLLAVPLCALASVFMLSDLAQRRAGGASASEELAMGVWNRATKRWEVPTHRDYFHERLVLMRKDNLNPSTPPPQPSKGMAMR
jgi:curved DNA-binding protein CbpA